MSAYFWRFVMIDLLILVEGHKSSIKIQNGLKIILVSKIRLSSILFEIQHAANVQ